MIAETLWERFDHGADIGVRGVGPTEEAAFEQNALALTGVITDPARVRPQTAVEIGCEAPTDELLVVDWLPALVYEMATRHMLFGAFTVALGESRLSATAWGEPVIAGGMSRPWKSKVRPTRRSVSASTSTGPGSPNVWWMCNGPRSAHSQIRGRVAD